jgi:hypothetical protein
MAYETPASILYNSSGVESSVVNGVAIPASTSAYLVAGSDGTNARYLTLDSSGRVIVAGAGTAGSSSGGILSVQGVSGGTALTVSGSGNFTVVQPSAAALLATVTQGNAGTAAQAWFTRISDGYSNALTLLNAAPAGTEYAAPVRQVGAVTVAQATAASLNATVVQSTAANLNATVVGNSNAGATVTTNLVVVQGSTTGTPVPVSGTLTTQKSTTATPANVAASITSVQLLASNANRITATVFNDSTSILYINAGATASATAFMIKVFPGSFYELTMPYIGSLTGIWAVANGTARVVEFTL